VEPATDSASGLLPLLASLRLQPVTSGQSDIVAALIPDCPTPIAIVLLRIDGGDDARAAAMLGPDKIGLYVYFGSAERQPSRLGLYGRWLTASAEAMLGARHTRAPARKALVILPAACSWLTALDWARLSPRT
jgi:hypothetical protein